MSQPNHEPHRPPLPPVLYKLVNPTLRLLLHTPLHSLLSGRLALLTFTGRTSGKRYQVPVGYVQQGNTVLINTQSRWQRNLAGGAEVTLRLRGQSYRGWAELLTDVQEMAAAYRTILAAAPQLGEFIGVGRELDGEPVRADVLTARERGYVIITVTLNA
jgi:hypothetical protein